MTGFERARSEAQKAQRRDALLAAAAALLDGQDFDGITLAAIAREAGFTRSNLYKYYRTREAIYLDLLSRELTDWTAAFAAALALEPATSAGFAAAWAGTLSPRPRLLRLLAILHTHLERGVSLERLVAYKRVLFQAMTQAVAALCARWPALEPEAAEGLLTVQVATVSGLFPMTHLNARQQQAAEAVGFRSYAGRFEGLCRAAAQAGLAAALAEAG